MGWTVLAAVRPGIFDVLYEQPLSLSNGARKWFASQSRRSIHDAVFPIHDQSNGLKGLANFARYGAKESFYEV